MADPVPPPFCASTCLTRALGHPARCRPPSQGAVPAGPLLRAAATAPQLREGGGHLGNRPSDRAGYPRAPAASALPALGGRVQAATLPELGAAGGEGLRRLLGGPPAGGPQGTRGSKIRARSTAPGGTLARGGGNLGI